MTMVSILINCAAVICPAIEMPRKMVTRFASTFCAVSERESSTPHSRMRLPNIKNPTSETAVGAKIPAMSVMMIGNRIRVVLETAFAS